jgi:hypothetical protein
VDVREVMAAAAKRLRLGVEGPRVADELNIASAAVAELVEAASAVADTTPEAQRENWSCHKGITTAAKCGRCGRELRLSAALARVGGSK